MQRILITGAPGFIGSHLTSFFRNKKDFRCAGPEFDLLKESSLSELFNDDPWDTVVHLAAISHVPTCEKDPEQARQVNVQGTQKLLEKIQKHSPRCHLIFSSTAQVYAEGRDGEPMTEEMPLSPHNLYAKTKREAESLIEGAAERWGLNATVLRIFNHTHKTQTPNFFMPYLYSQLKNHRSGRLELKVGNLNLYRDIGALQDLLNAIEQAVLKGKESPGIGYFNVCSGKAKKLETLASLLADRLNVDVQFVPDPSKMREGEPFSISGSNNKFSKEFSWEPRVRTESELVQAFLSDIEYPPSP